MIFCHHDYFTGKQEFSERNGKQMVGKKRGDVKLREHFSISLFRENVD